MIADPAYMLLCVGEAIGPSGLPKFAAIARLLQNKNGKGTTVGRSPVFKVLTFHWLILHMWQSETEG